MKGITIAIIAIASTMISCDGRYSYRSAKCIETGIIEDLAIHNLQNTGDTITVFRQQCGRELHYVILE